MLKTWRWVASALISATVLAIIPASAKADGTQHFTDINNTFYSQKIINDCFYQAQPAEFKKEFTSQPWLWMTKDSNTGVAIGRYISPGGSNLDGSTNGWIKCNNEGVMNQATRSFLEYAKYADIDAFVKELGYTVITKQECARMSTGTYPTCVENRNVEFYSLNGKKANMAAIQSKTPPQSSPALYFALNTIFTRECVATSGMQITRKVIVEDPPGSQKYISQDASVTIKSISPGGYNNGGVTYGSTATPLTAYDYNNQNTNCKDLSAKIDGLTGATLAFNSQNPDLAITTSATATTSPDKTGAGEPTEAASTCTVEAVGWLVCPVMKFTATLNDGLSGFLFSSLEFKAEFLKTDSGAYKAWQSFLNIANVMFVIAFMAIVLSQVTSIGISNYGIKKLLPKLVIVAILVNISYYICQLAVDISNLLGYSLKELLDSVRPATTATDVNWVEIIGLGLMSGVALIGLFLAISVPVLFAAFLSLASAALIIFAQKSIVILLTVLSPLAFVAMLLPNTEKLFKRWREIFTSMLILFPTVSLLFGAGNLASAILMEAAGNDDPGMKIAALGAGVLPLLAIIPLLQNALKSTGALGAKLSGLNQKANSRIGKKVGDSSMIGAYKKAYDRNQQIKRAQITGGTYKGRGPLAKIASATNRRLNSTFGSVGTRTAQQAASLEKKLEVENIEASNAQIQQANISAADLKTVANGGKIGALNGGDAGMRAAAMVELAERGEMGGLADAWDEVSANGNDEERRIVANALARSSSRPKFIGQGALQGLRDGTASNFDTTALQGIEAGSYSPEAIANASAQELDYAHRVASRSAEAGDTVAMNNLHSAANTALSNPDIDKNVGKNRSKLNEFLYESVYNDQTPGRESRRRSDGPPPPNPPRTPTNP